jgi:hypothetical protein
VLVTSQSHLAWPPAMPARGNHAVCGKLRNNLSQRPQPWTPTTTSPARAAGHGDQARQAVRPGMPARQRRTDGRKDGSSLRTCCGGRRGFASPTCYRPNRPPPAGWPVTR